METSSFYFSILISGHDNSGAGAGWNLDCLSVLCVESGLEQSFPCGQWLALDEADGLIERTLMPDKGHQEQKRTKTPYEIEVRLNIFVRARSRYV